MASEGKLPVSVCMIVRDEETYLARCLASVGGFASEIVVADTGSSDGSLRIAEAFGAIAFALPWTGDFAAARNAALAMASQPWILALDADEEWASPTEELERLLAPGGLPTERFGYFVTVASAVGDGEETVTDAVCRLFRNDPRIRFAGMIHEEVATSILAFAPQGLAASSLLIRHKGYLDETIRRKNKPERNLAILREALRQRPDEPVLRYALGTEFFGRGEYGKALEIFLPLLNVVPGEEGYASDLRLKTAYALRESGRLEEALLLTERMLPVYPDYASLLELRAALLIEAHEYDEAFRLARLAEATGESRGKAYSEASGAGTYRSRYLAGTIHERRRRYSEACEEYERALAYHPGHAPSWRRLAVLSAATERMDRLEAVVARARARTG